VLAFGLLVAGCSSTGRNSNARYQPSNVYSPIVVFPQTVKRVALLPLTTDESDIALRDGREALEPVLNEELVKMKKFEIVQVSPDFLKSRTGRSKWTGQEVLPADFLSSLRETYACDAVLFCQLTVFQPYPPLAVGWRMKLVDARSQQVLWAGDESFDAAQDKTPGPRKSRSSRFNPWHEDPPPANPRLENSPRTLARYSMAELFATMPHTSAELFGNPEAGKSF
jgi:hypothetical protein